MVYKIIDVCISCGVCEVECFVSCILVGDDVYVIDVGFCIDCGFCVGVCFVDVF